MKTININGKGYIQNCDNTTFYNNIKNGTQYLIATKLVLSYNQN